MDKPAASPFADLLEGRDLEWVIAESSHYVAVLEKRPLAPGHVVVVAKRFEDDLLALSDTELAELLPFAKRVSGAIRRVVPCRKVGVAVIGLETRHAHLHLVPLQSADDLNFTRAKLSPAPAELHRLLKAIRAALPKD